jgi:hypothetical protein
VTTPKLAAILTRARHAHALGNRNICTRCRTAVVD